MGMLTDRHTAKRKPEKKKKKKTPTTKQQGKNKSVCFCIGQWGFLHRGACEREREREPASRQRELPRLLASGTRPFSVVTSVNTIDDEKSLTEAVIKD